MVWHLDVGLSFPKSVGSLIGGSAHPSCGHYFIWRGFGDVKNRTLFPNCYTLNAPKKHLLAAFPSIISHFHIYSPWAIFNAIILKFSPWAYVTQLSSKLQPLGQYFKITAILILKQPLGQYFIS
jgi:hypothetical protein